MDPAGSEGIKILGGEIEPRVAEVRDFGPFKRQRPQPEDYE